MSKFQSTAFHFTLHNVLFEVCLNGMQDDLSYSSSCALLSELGLHKEGVWLRECSCGSSRKVPWGSLAPPIPPWHPGQPPIPLPSLAPLICLPQEHAPSLQHAVSHSCGQRCNRTNGAACAPCFARSSGAERPQSTRCNLLRASGDGH